MSLFRTVEPPFHLRAPRSSDTSHSSSNGTHTATPTPTDVQRLLAGQTPNNHPPIDNHPLNISYNPQPYATTEDMKAMHLHATGQAYPSPVKSQLYPSEFYTCNSQMTTLFSQTTPMIHGVSILTELLSL